jgi:hypothetical protein
MTGRKNVRPLDSWFFGLDGLRSLPYNAAAGASSKLAVFLCFCPRELDVKAIQVLSLTVKFLRNPCADCRACGAESSFAFTAKFDFVVVSTSIVAHRF